MQRDANRLMVRSSDFTILKAKQYMIMRLRTGQERLLAGICRTTEIVRNTTFDDDIKNHRFRFNSSNVTQESRNLKSRSRDLGHAPFRSFINHCVHTT